jgi:hypothetical protein
VLNTPVAPKVSSRDEFAHLTDEQLAAIVR